MLFNLFASLVHLLQFFIKCFLVWKCVFGSNQIFLQFLSLCKFDKPAVDFRVFKTNTYRVGDKISLTVFVNGR